MGCLGELESIVQAHPEDKKRLPGQWRQHRYELSIATQANVDEDTSPERPEGIPPPTLYEQGPQPAEGECWRCLKCYNTRFSTMCFGENSAPSSRICRFCNMPQEEAGWTLWRRYGELPLRTQRRIDQWSGPKILSVLRTRWDRVEISFYDGAGAFMPLESEDFRPENFIIPIV
eukprot:NODE_5063_length_615_cov_270.230357.p2 GENE.NODE_5063_length_615_cov_270.230357~~NODE_5063_length_615_cov_270.230357.p2  ORF type:complete len:174 (+),score=35.10 NODE_5063_length_615_cov_270.230357:3-524(+)